MSIIERMVIDMAFARRYTAADVALLAEVDRAMYRLSEACHGLRAALPAPCVRRLVRIDSVHQGDFDGFKGLYHINAVDCVTQWQVVASVQTIAENHLLPVIEQMLEQFPFEILASTPTTAASTSTTAWRGCWRSYASSSRAAAGATATTTAWPNQERRGGAQIFGYEHIAQRHAGRFKTFCIEYLNPFLNFHRPGLFATEVPDAKKPGRIKRVYRPKDAMAPLDKLSSLCDAANYLRKGVTLEELQQLARALSDVQAAEELNEARAALFRRVPARTR